MDRLTLLWDNLMSLGAKRLSALGLTFVLIFGLVGLGGYYLSRPAFETLYAGLEREDVSRIGATLKAAGISFDINPEGNAVSVHYG
jgi:flagellar M-ring protein FliF